MVFAQQSLAEFVDAVKGRSTVVPISLIVDSVWIPKFMNMKTIEYYLYPDRWLEANLAVIKMFPEVYFLPGFWVEYGMAIEPSAFGCKIIWNQYSTPSIIPVIDDSKQAFELKCPDFDHDGLMPFALELYAYLQEKVGERGFKTSFVAGRGPLTIASYVRGLTNLLSDMYLAPASVHKILEVTTETSVIWLKAQLKLIKGPLGILLLDDIPGLISPKQFEEFGFPYLKKIFDEFKGLLKVYHNDTNTSHILERLADTGFDVFNLGYEIDIGEAKKKIGDRVTLMGNIAPLDVLARGKVEEVEKKAEDCVKKASQNGRFILSAGGGVSPDTPKENIQAMIRVAMKYRETK